jgi:methylglyoxal synthase
VCFSLDLLTAQPHDQDIQPLMRVCNVHNVPPATRLATANPIIAGLADEERVAAFREAERGG